MKTKRNIIHYSLFALLIGMMPTYSNAGLRVSKYSRGYQSNAYQNPVINTVQQQTVTTPSTDTENNLPVRVADENLAKEIDSIVLDPEKREKMGKKATKISIEGVEEKIYQEIEKSLQK